MAISKEQRKLLAKPLINYVLLPLGGLIVILVLATIPGLGDSFSGLFIVTGSSLIIYGVRGAYILIKLLFSMLGLNLSNIILVATWIFLFIFFICMVCFVFKVRYENLHH